MKYILSFWNYKKFYVICKILFFLSIIKLSICNQQNENHLYPANHTFNYQFYQTTQLINEDVLFIASDGIHVYSPNLSIERTDKNVAYEINPNSAPKVTLSKFDDGHIISIINDKLNFFSPEGDLLVEKSLDTYILSDNAEYYTLNAFEINENNYFYYIGYVNSNNLLSLYYFSINNITTDNVKIHSTTYTPKSNTGATTTILHKGHSCELMRNSSRKVLTCFFVTKSPASISHASFTISSKGIIAIDEVVQFYRIDKYGSVKSSPVKENPKNALICYCGSDSDFNCLSYNIINNKFNNVVGGSNDCKSSYLGVTINYISKTREFLVSHIVNNVKGRIKILQYYSI